MAKLTPPVNQYDHLRGSGKTSVELVEYGDFQCPHCGAAYPIVKMLEETFTGRIDVIFRHFPLSEIHPFAEAAAVAAEAAGNQDKFWQMHDMIFEHQQQLNSRALFAFAEKLSLNMTSFEADITDEKLVGRVEANFESGIRSGVNGTPSFFINGIKYNGAYDFESLSEAIESVLQEKHLR